MKDGALRQTVFLLPVLLIAAAGWRNPLDGIVRGKWVRHWDTRKGEHSATLCAPARSPDELDQHLNELPGVVDALLDAGVAAIAIDLPLTEPHPAHDHLAAVVAEAPVVLPVPVIDGTVGSPADPLKALVEGPDGGQPVGHREMKHSWPPRAVLGAHGPVGAPDGVWPLALQALALHQGVEAPAQQDDGRVSVGRFTFAPTDAHLIFMPYEIPFLHWDRREEWSDAAGKVVFIGACRLDRDLTRFGRQPGAVAHGELLETAIDDVFPWRAPAPVDMLLAGLAWLATLGARLLMPSPSLLGPALIGLVGTLAVLLVALEGVWLGLSGIVAAAVCGWLAGRGR